MRLLTKIIGQAPSELEPGELMNLVKRNRVRIRKEIKEYRRLKNAIRAEMPKAQRGRPLKKKEIENQRHLEMAMAAKELGMTIEDILKEIRANKEKDL